MNTDSTPAFGAGPSHLFIPNKSSDSQLFDILEIFNHTHMVLGPVSFIQMFQVATWKPFTFKTISCTAVLKDPAGFDFTLGTRNRFMGVIASTSGTWIPFP